MKNKDMIYITIIICLIFFITIIFLAARQIEGKLIDCNEDYVSEYSKLKECKATKEICYKVLMEKEQDLEICNQLKNYTETDSVKPDESIICPTEKCKKIGYSCLQIYNFDNIAYSFQCVKKMITD